MLNPQDSEQRSRLLSLKLRALVRDHLGTDTEGTAEMFALGSAFVTPTDVWVLIDGDASRSLGPVLAWTAKYERPVQLLTEQHAGLLARRASLFDVALTVWQVHDRSLSPAVAEPYAARVDPKPEHLAFIDLIESSGANPVIEHGVVVGEVRGLEMCRVVDDATTGVSRLEVGMGVNDREAFAMVHGEMPTEEAMRNVIASVAVHREPGANSHPFNQFGAERLHRWRALQNPRSIGFTKLEPVDPPTPRTNLKDAVPCAAFGTTDSGKLSAAIFVHGVDLDVVPFAVDVAARLGAAEVSLVIRRRDITPSIQGLANMASIQVRITTVSGN